MDTLIKLEYRYQKYYNGKKKRNYFISEYSIPDNKRNFQRVVVLCQCGFRKNNAERIYKALLKDN